MRGRQALLEQQAHRVTLVAEGRLHGDQHLAELLAQHQDRAAVAELSTRRRTPLGLDFLEIALAPDVLVGGDQRVHVGVGTLLRGLALQHAVAKRVDAVGQVDRVALGLHRDQGV
jgi:hypothetical protein